MPDEPQRTEGEPHDRLTRLCAAMMDVFDVHAEHGEGDKAIVMLDDGHRGGIVLHGYDDDMDAMVDLLVHVRAVFRASGKDLQLITVPDSPEGID